VAVTERYFAPLLKISLYFRILIIRSDISIVVRLVDGVRVRLVDRIGIGYVDDGACLFLK
jgi:hypothetical protein